MSGRTWSKMRAVVLGAAVACAGAGLGCATEVPVRSGAVVDGEAAALREAGGGWAWEAVFLPAGTAVAMGGGEPSGRAEYSRLDGRLPVRHASPVLATAQWPEPERPSVERVRRVFLERDARTALFFLPRREGGRREWWWGR